jgi:hypothetical protein
LASKFDPSFGTKSGVTILFKAVLLENKAESSLKDSFRNIPCNMVRKTLSILVLVSMVLHCAGRLGVLSLIYQNRHDLATAVGLVSEKPITTCKSDYFQLKGINLTQDENHDDAPVIVALEITLFYQSLADFSYSIPASKSLDANTNYAPVYQHNFLLDVFHPPQV